MKISIINKHWRQHFFTVILLASILLVGFFFRSFNRNWDQNSHLNPDERFLTMVGNAAKLPDSFTSYLDPETSLLNPRNLNYSFFVYGNFPIIANTYLANWLNMDNYQDFTLLGRTTSAILDTLVIVLLFFIVWEIEKKYQLPSEIKFLSALLYSLAVLPIQQSHFFTTDSYTQFFGWLSIFFSVRYHVDDKRKMSIIFSGFFIGLSIASKISGILFVPIASILLFRFDQLSFPIHRKQLINLLTRTSLIAIVWTWYLYFTLRLASPYYFASGDLFSPKLHPQFLANLTELKGWNNPNIWFPPGVQWISATPIMPVENIIRYGLGIPFAIFSFIGLIFLIDKMWQWKLRKPFILILSGWTISFLFYYSFQYVKTMRYFLSLYPVFAFFAAFGVYQLNFLITKSFTKKKISNILLPLLMAIGIVLILIWPLSFLSIYIHPHSRISASTWVYQNLPENSMLAKEHWDDGIPFGKIPVNKKFEGVELAVFNQDSEEKMELLNQQLSQTDYYILSSNRAWKSISDAPQKYPLMSQFYQDLFNNETDFRLVNEFHSFPSLRYLGIPIDFDDSKAEEAFTVYDHPKVYVFERQHSAIKER